MKRKLLFGVCVLFTVTAFSQIRSDRYYPAQQLTKAVTGQYASDLDATFKDYELFELNTNGIYDITKTDNSPEFTLQLGAHKWDLKLERYDVRGADYKLVLLTSDGRKEYGPGPVITYRGIADNDPDKIVRMTIAEDYVSALIFEDNRVYNIEPVSNYTYKTGPVNHLILYENADLRTEGIECGTITNDAAAPPINNAPYIEVNSRSSSVCYQADVAIAATFDLYQAKGSSKSSAETFLIDHFNKSQAYYVPLDIEHILQGIVISTSTSEDMSTSGNATGVRNDFAKWADNGGFGSIPFDMGSLILARFRSGIVGQATYKGLCKQDAMSKTMFADISQGPHTLAHEWGHAWASPHDNQDFGSIIMRGSCPGNDCVMIAVGTSGIKWSDKTKELILEFAATASCLETCKPTAPTAVFSSDVTLGCGPLTVRFLDNSRQNPTSWLWEFGDGGTSTEQNPVYTYAAPGKYTVKLTVSNEVGSNSSEKTEMIIVEEGEPYPAQKVGEQNKDIGAGGYAGGGRFMIFDALEDMTLVSIKVYPETSGNIQLALLKNNGSTTIIGGASFQVKAPEDRVTLNWEIPAGTRYELALMPGTPVNLYRNQDGATYPHNIDNLISIHSNYWAEQGNPKEGWYVGYDWEVSKKGCTTVVGIQEATLNKIKVFPNPGMGVFQLSLPQDLIGTNIDVSLYNLNGQLVYSSPIQAAAEIIPLDITDLAVGTYILKLKSEQWVENIRMTKL